MRALRRLFTVEVREPRSPAREPVVELHVRHWDNQLHTHVIYQTLRVPLSQAKEIYADLGAEITKAEARQ